ncbi:molybdopterin-binding protein [Microvirga sp. W0021]|uniref:Molybdopterin-binding protein n=1 Tax=Hohaiivirga grylli TaxID=3133970 RepID=A0ABV0BPL5_9HYPH
MTQNAVTAAILVIGDEILSGRTKDKNIGYVADYLTALGIDLCEVRIVPDVEVEIVEALNALRHRYTYVFTTGGIGPTHDDITADSVAKAFNVEIHEDPRAIEMLLVRFKQGDLNEARRRMARIPVGASLIENPVSNAPGFNIGNVFVMAGVPAIMQAMLDNVAPLLQNGVKVLSEIIEVPGIKEGDYGVGLAKIASAFPDVSIGSYPHLTETGFSNQIVVRSRDGRLLKEAVKAVHDLLKELQAQGF